MSVERVVEALDRDAARMLAPENIRAMLVQSLDTLKTVALPRNACPALPLRSVRVYDPAMNDLSISRSDDPSATSRLSIL